MKLRNSLSAFGIWLVFFTGEEKKIMSPPATVNAINTTDEFCGITNKAFQAGEQVTFHVYYSVAGTYIHAGTAIFTATLENFGINQCIMSWAMEKQKRLTTGSIK
jgi:hypothetical protein